MEPLPEGGFVIAATTQSFGQPHFMQYDGSLWIIRISMEGRIESSVIYTPPTPAIFYDSALLPDKSIVVVGGTGDYRSAVITRITEDGTPVFYEYLSPDVPVYTIGLTGVEYYKGNIVAIGYFFDLTRYKAIQWIVLLDPNGTVLSSIGIDLGSPYYYPIPFSIYIYGDLAVIAGYGYTNPGFIIGYNLSSSTIEYAYSVGDSSGDDYYGVAATDNRLILVGVTDSLGGEDAAIVSLWSNGTLNWGLIIRSNGTDRLFGIHLDDKYVYVSGWTQPQPDIYGNDTLLAKIRIVDGNLEWYRIIGSKNDDWAYRIYVDQAGNIYSIGGYGSPYARDNILILRLDKNGNTPSCPLIRNETLISVSYSPTVIPLTPTIIIYNTTATPQPLTYSNMMGDFYRICPVLVGGTAYIGKEKQHVITYIVLSVVLVASLIRWQKIARTGSNR